MKVIPDLMMCLGNVSGANVRQIRKTEEDLPRVSVIDTIALITGQSQSNSHTCGRGYLQFIRKLLQIVEASSSSGKDSGRKHQSPTQGASRRS